MKKRMLGLMLAAVAICGQAANGDTKLKVKLDLVDFGDTVVVYSPGYQEQTFTGKDGQFEFEIDVDNVRIAMLIQPKLIRNDMDDMRVYMMPLVGGESARMWDKDRTRYDVDGTGFYADYHQVDLFNDRAMEERSKTRDNERYLQTLTDYIKAHPKQEAAIVLLSYINDPAKLKDAFMLFDTSIRNGRMKPLYDDWLKDAEKQQAAEAREREAQKKQAAGVEAPLFTLNDLEGKPFELTSLRGKYVILDFWGSWCVWCIKGFPQMKEYYAKYPGKFEILGIDCNDTQEKWKAAVEKHELPWLHVYCPRGATLLADYGISAFPTKIIIGPDGKIVKTIVGEDPAFYTLLDELFSK